MYKRLYAVLLLFCVILTLSACGEADQTAQRGSDSSAESAETPVSSLSSEDETAEPETSGGESQTPDETGAESSQSTENNASADSNQGAGNNGGNQSQSGNTGNDTGSGAGSSSGTSSTPAPSAVVVTGVTLNQTAVTLEIGGTTQLTATVSPSNATNKTVTWSSGNTGGGDGRQQRQGYRESGGNGDHYRKDGQW